MLSFAYSIMPISSAASEEAGLQWLSKNTSIEDTVKVTFSLTKRVLILVPKVVKCYYGNKGPSLWCLLFPLVSCYCWISCHENARQEDTWTSQYRPAMCPNMFLWATQTSAGAGGYFWRREGNLGAQRHKMYSRHVKSRNISSGTDVSDVNILFPNSSLIPS